MPRSGVARQQRAQLDDVLRKELGRLVEVLAQRALQFGSGPRRAAEPEVDPPRKQRVERAELLGDGERIVVGQHDPARTDADRRVAWPTWPITTEVAAPPMPSIAWCSAIQKRL